MLNRGEDRRFEVNPTERAELLEFALSAAADSQEIIAKIVADGFSVEHKSDASPVTIADKKAEESFREKVTRAFPQMGLCGEEFGVEREEADFQWVIDPIDGTAEFAQGMPEYGTIIGLFYKGYPIVSVMNFPALGLCYSASFEAGCRLNKEILKPLQPSGKLGSGVRVGMAARTNFIRYEDEGYIFDAVVKAFPNIRIYHSCYTHSLAIAGAVDVTLEWNLRPWDLAATELMIEEVGGDYRPIYSLSARSDSQIRSAVFGKQDVVEAVSAVVQSLL